MMQEVCQYRYYYCYHAVFASKLELFVVVWSCVLHKGSLKYFTCSNRASVEAFDMKYYSTGNGFLHRSRRPENAKEVVDVPHTST
jgi:hypothetical protein